MAKADLIDLDGVLVKGRPDIPGAHVATGVTPIQFKPNPLMMRSALRHLKAHSEHTVMIGDRMDTDMVAGIESGME